MPLSNDSSFADILRISNILGINALKVIDAMLESTRPKGHITGSDRISDDYNK